MIVVYTHLSVSIDSILLYSCLVLLGGSGDDEEHNEEYTEEHKRKRQVHKTTFTKNVILHSHTHMYLL